MTAITVEPGVAGSARLDDLARDAAEAGDVLVETLAVGVCGTDAEILAGGYGWAPPGSPRLVLGHEALGRVLYAPTGSGLVAGDLVVPMVRQPDPVPCRSCAVGEWDMCLNGRYTEHGIRARDGFARERFRLPADRLVVLDPVVGASGVLLEPASVVAKAWEQVERIGGRTSWFPHRVLVTGAGPIGLLAALLYVQRGYDTHVVDVVSAGPKPELVAALGATYHSRPLKACGEADVVIECTGVGSVVLDVIGHNGPSSVVCLVGLSAGARALAVDVGDVNRRLVLENDVVFGSVSANRRHYQQAAEALALADRQWLERMVTRRVRAERWHDAFDRTPEDVKVVLDFAG